MGRLVDANKLMGKLASAYDNAITLDYKAGIVEAEAWLADAPTENDTDSLEDLKASLIDYWGEKAKKNPAGCLIYGDHLFELIECLKLRKKGDYEQK